MSSAAYASAVAAAALQASGYGGVDESSNFESYAYEEARGGGFEDAEAGGGGNYYYAAAGEANTHDYIVDEAAANADVDVGPRLDGEHVPGGRYVRFVRGGAGGGGVGGSAAAIGGRSIFEEMNAPVPENIALPAPDAVTIFDVPLHFHRSRPWDDPGVDRDAYFNYALDSRTFAQYATRQQRVRTELTHIMAARASAANANVPNVAAIAQAQYAHNMQVQQQQQQQQQQQH